MALPEVEDAVMAYDEMLAFRDFLDNGEVLTYEIPRSQDDGVVWSGMRLGSRAGGPHVQAGRRKREADGPTLGPRGVRVGSGRGRTNLSSRKKRTGAESHDLVRSQLTTAQRYNNRAITVRIHPKRYRAWPN